ncbi:carboxypeptidase-like regulatory domain-containing protein [Carboxylicivirga sp. A043]|uniref:TonB-dependent receptor n=1 Tax=Carboxylicivirga litoralis TaxID=2816963 RepID=UPI0021CAE531|nr:TonB-dependent receptor [Carboxylicivirga sp. A043]MCU4157991.1 carboxypeptidase-like regulatory domain-containing protein [Carboxylicivirga sp. A043]
MKYIFFNIICFVCIVAHAQESKWCISGQVVASDNSEGIPSVHVTTLDGKKGTVTDADGAFELCGLAGESVTIKIGHTAFENQQLTVERDDNKPLTIRLNFKVYQASEVQINASQKNIVKNYIPGKLTLKKEDVLAIPAFLGSPDVLRGLQLLPGMQSVSEGNGGIYVRGGSPGQNFVLFDNIELMNPTHLMGIYSVFNPLLTNKVDFYKGNAPIHLSSRLASSIIVDTYSQKPDSSNWSGNLGNIVSNLTYNGQSKNKRWYFNTGIRRSYLDVLGYMASPFLEDENNYFKQNNYTFYDWNGKLHFKSGNDKLVLSWYLGYDDFKMTSKQHEIESNSEWGNKGISFLWNKLLSSNLSMENTISYSSYFSDFGANIPDGSMRFATDYEQYQFKNRFSYQLNKHYLRWGLELTRYDIVPQDLKISYLENSEASLDDYQSTALRLFASNHFQISPLWSVYAGAALNYYRLEEASGQNIKSDAPQILPNVITSLNYNPTKLSSYKLSYAFNTQNIHLASIASIPLPSDIWMPATNALPLEKGHQVTLGFFREYPEYQLQWGLEGYGKYMDNQLLLKFNLEQKELDSFDENFYKGQGLAYGTELYINKQGKNFNLTIGYTLGWAKQQFDDINDGKWHDAKYDRRHDLNLQATYVLNKRIDFGTVFIYASGNKATLPTGRYWLMGTIANDYAGVNNYRMPAYHRMDVSMNYHLTSKLFAESIINFSIINIYGRSNPYYIYYQVEEGQKDYELSIKAKQVSLFPIMPSISWRFKF